MIHYVFSRHYYSKKVAYLFSKTKCPSWPERISCVLYKRFSCILQLPAFMSLSHSKDIIIGIVTKMVWVQPRELGHLKLCKHHFQKCLSVNVQKAIFLKHLHGLIFESENLNSFSDFINWHPYFHQSQLGKLCNLKVS